MPMTYTERSAKSKATPEQTQDVYRGWDHKVIEVAQALRRTCQGKLPGRTSSAAIEGKAGARRAMAGIGGHKDPAEVVESVGLLNPKP